MFRVEIGRVDSYDVSYGMGSFRWGVWAEKKGGLERLIV